MSERTLKIFAILPKVTGSLSWLGSTYVLYAILPHRDKRQRTFHRLVLGLALSDWIGSTMNVLGTWPIPKTERFSYWNVGTQATCTAQGFFYQLSLPTSSLYIAFLGLYYTAQIRYRLPRQKIVYYEKLAHAFIWAVGLAMALAGVALDLYNNSGILCWLAEHPLYCQGDTCLRGENARYLHWYFFFLWHYVGFVVMMVSLTLVYCKVRHIETRSSTYRIPVSESSTVEGPSRARSQAVFYQGLRYFGAFLVTVSWPTIIKIYTARTGERNLWLTYVQVAFLPLYGFWNALIYDGKGFLQCTGIPQLFGHCLKSTTGSLPFLMSGRNSPSRTTDPETNPNSNGSSSNSHKPTQNVSSSAEGTAIETTTGHQTTT